jgi:hypothetical protein
MSLKTENSRRVAKSRAVCMGLNFPVWTTGKLDEFLVLDGNPS